MTRLPAIREAFAQAKRANADLLFPESASWSDGVTRRFKVGDPNRLTGTAPLALVNDPMPASLRLLKVHPDDPRPDPGASCTCSEGYLVLGVWTDEGKLSGSRSGVCRLVDERAYPLTATIGAVGFRIRIQARDAAALAVSGEGLSGTANDSHLGHLPPGVHLQPGEVITTAEGDRYQVVPPVQRDALGDTVGLSWQGQGSGHAPLPEPASGDPTPDVPPAPDAPTPGRDPWWDEGLP